ncbi:hypothetical protein ON010_g10498 [Phytophthora cinnamomi]|nr:hypothetical protein ON010_g10498 [Phytophthora cinnamomi]
MPRGILRRPEAVAKGQEGGNVDADDGSDNPDDSPLEDDSESTVQEHYRNLLATADDSAEVTDAEKDVAISSEALEEDSSTSESTAHDGKEVQQANGAPGHTSMTQTIPARSPNDSLALRRKRSNQTSQQATEDNATVADDSKQQVVRLLVEALIQRARTPLSWYQATASGGIWSGANHCPPRDRGTHTTICSEAGPSSNASTRSRFQMERMWNYDIQLTSRADPSVAEDSRHGFDVGVMQLMKQALFLEYAPKIVLGDQSWSQ